MPAGLDIALVVLAVLLAAGYIVRRKLHLVKGAQRDWTTGHGESCENCVVAKIRKEQVRAMSRQR